MQAIRTLAIRQAATAAHSGSGSGTLLIVIVVIALVVGYFVSLRLHPFARCSACRGTPGRHWGSIYRNSQRLCRKCGGTGRQPRLGVKLTRPPS